MKHTKRLLALLLALALAFALAMPALAKDTPLARQNELTNKVVKHLKLDLTGWRLNLFSAALSPYIAAADVSDFLRIPPSVAAQLQLVLLFPLTILLQPLFLIATGRLVIPY